jgi:2-keto-myo-inositol isomerase
MSFALNHMVAPLLDHAAFFDLASHLGVNEVEIRNDLADVAIFDGTPAADVRAAAANKKLRILTINALQRFNEWNSKRAAEARELVRYARESGAEALVLCPVNDTRFTPSNSERLAGLRTALKELKPMLTEVGLKGFVEPLGFPECSLRLKAEAVDAIDAVDGAQTFRVVHDTFHHYVAGEKQMFPERTGIVHASGVSDKTTGRDSLRDPHRLLVDGSDRLGNVEQIRALRSGGYQGPVSLEPFAAEVHTSASLEKDLRSSLDYLRASI